LWQQSLTAEDATRPQLVRRLPTTEQVVAWFAQSEEGTLSEGVLRLTQDIGNLFGQAALAVVISIYWSADQLRFERLWLSLLAPDRRARARQFWRRLQADVGSYIRSEAAQTLLAGGLLLATGWLLGVKYPWMLALLASLAWLIPLIGGAIAVLAAALIGLLSSPLIAVASVIATIVILALMEFGVERRLYAHDRYWGVLVVLVMLALGDALGLVGLLVAPPVAVALQFALNEVLDRPAAPAVAMAAPQAMSLDQLQERLDAIRLQLGESDQDASHRLRNLAARLEQLLIETASNVTRP
ncbi:MAG: AI-2E family transporter, partial [Caldilineaceae bacterium]|nr:AI-2E family transporter [Caldilineaceae bacterium]